MFAYCTKCGEELMVADSTVVYCHLHDGERYQLEFSQKSHKITCGFPDIPSHDGGMPQPYCPQPGTEFVDFDVPERGTLHVPACPYHADMYYILWPAWRLAQCIETGKIKGEWLVAEKKTRGTE